MDCTPDHSLELSSEVNVSAMLCLNGMLHDWLSTSTT